MKILVLSNTPWSIDNSFGNSFSNIFEGIDGLEIANIYCRYGKPKNNIVKKHFQITEKSLLKNLKNSEYPSGKEIFDIHKIDVLHHSQKKVFNYTRKKRLQIFFWARNIIWKVGNWESSELKEFIDDFNPDIIFQPVYYSTYLNDIALYIKQLTNKPMVCYVSDDVYTLQQFSLSPLYWINRFMIRPKVKEVIENCENLYVISEIQKKEYERQFNKKCKILTKGADFKESYFLKKNQNKILKIVYTGNIGAGRWKTLALIGDAIKEINIKDCKIQLFIYTTTPLTNKMLKRLNDEKNIFIMKSVPGDQVEKIQNDADILLHVESFVFKEKLQLRQSFSTKIVDYFYRARCIFAVGPPEVASIDYLIKNDAAIVAINKNQIKEQLNKIVTDPLIISEYAKKAWECGEKNHQISEIQKELYEDLKSLIEEDNNENITN